MKKVRFRSLKEIMNENGEVVLIGRNINTIVYRNCRLTGKTYLKI